MKRGPVRIPIWGESWKIVERKVVKAEDGTVCAGLCDFTKKEIRLARDQGDADTLDTLIHELLHASSRDALSEEYVAEMGKAIAAGLLAWGAVPGQDP